MLRGSLTQNPSFLSKFCLRFAIFRDKPTGFFHFFSSLRLLNCLKVVISTMNDCESSTAYLEPKTKPNKQTRVSNVTEIEVKTLSELIQTDVSLHLSGKTLRQLFFVCSFVRLLVSLSAHIFTGFYLAT